MKWPGAGKAKPMGLLKTGTAPVAVDFGHGSLKVLQVSTQGDAPVLVSAACVPTPSELISDPQARLTFQIEALPKLVRQAKIKSKRAVCNVPAAMGFCKHMQLAKTDGVSVGPLVRSALPEQLGCVPDALVIRHREVEAPPRGGKVEVICQAVGRDLVDRLMQGLRAAKLEPVGIHDEPQALLHALAGVGELSGDDPTLYVDLGGGSTKIVVARGTSLLFARVVEVGGRHLDEIVAEDLGVDPDEARTLRRRATSLEPSEAGFDVSEPLEIIEDEIAMGLRYYESLCPEAPVQRAVFVGGESSARPVCEHVARRLRLRSQVADPLARVSRTGKEPTEGVDVTGPLPGWAVTLGMCLAPTDL